MLAVCTSSNPQGTSATTLTLEEQFLAPPCTRIKASREEGIRALMRISTTDDTELGMLYLPDEDVWMTHTIERHPRSVKKDLRCTLQESTETFEYWHTHNRLVAESKNVLDNPLYWLIPSPRDLKGLYELGSFPLHVKGGIATTYVAISFEGEEYHRWGTPGFEEVLEQEATDLRTLFYGVTTHDELEVRAAMYCGKIRITIELLGEPLPKTQKVD